MAFLTVGSAMAFLVPSHSPPPPRHPPLSLSPAATIQARVRAPSLLSSSTQRRPPSFLSFSTNKAGPGAARPGRRRGQETVGSPPQISTGTTVAGGGSPVNGAPGAHCQEAAGGGTRPGRPPLDEEPRKNPPTTPAPPPLHLRPRVATVRGPSWSILGKWALP